MDAMPWRGGRTRGGRELPDKQKTQGERYKTQGERNERVGCESADEAVDPKGARGV
jgi:hypothetical protein